MTESQSNGATPAQVQARFKPGVSGNPGGAPRGTPQVKKRLRHALLRRLRDNPDQIDAIVDGLINGCVEGDAACQRLAWDRVDGVLEKQVSVRGSAIVKVIVRGDTT